MIQMNNCSIALMSLSQLTISSTTVANSKPIIAALGAAKGPLLDVQALGDVLTRSRASAQALRVRQQAQEVRDKQTIAGVAAKGVDTSVLDGAIAASKAARDANNGGVTVPDPGASTSNIIGHDDTLAAPDGPTGNDRTLFSDAEECDDVKVPDGYPRSSDEILNLQNRLITITPDMCKAFTEEKKKQVCDKLEIDGLTLREQYLMQKFLDCKPGEYPTAYEEWSDLVLEERGEHAISPQVTLHIQKKLKEWLKANNKSLSP